MQGPSSPKRPTRSKITLTSSWQEWLTTVAMVTHYSKSTVQHRCKKLQYMQMLIHYMSSLDAWIQSICWYNCYNKWLKVKSITCLNVLCHVIILLLYYIFCYLLMNCHWCGCHCDENCASYQPEEHGGCILHNAIGHNKAHMT